MTRQFLSFSLIIALLAASGPAQAKGLFGRMGQSTKPSQTGSDVMPPAGYQGQWWTHPNGCEYSRAGRPGEVSWYLILNTAHADCAAYFTQVPYRG